MSGADPSAADLAALVASRICHDLVNPLGAVAAGLELLEASGPQGGGEERALVAESLAGALARLRLLRIAFGQAAPGATLARREIAEALGGVYGRGRLAVVWQPLAERARSEVRLALLGLLCLETALPRGGQVTIGDATGAAAGWRLVAEGPRLHAEGRHWESLASGPEAATAREVPFSLFAAAAAAIGRRPRLERGAERLVLLC
ncbi:MAG: histidine phosphotransferase [Alphaproteobacteria bacterium HGW-Alphaproteobacteria-2]|nr:MAG: histidine phosphotransferase [Alphaproteobacteria bacterium HGW-Alphaproteobacteria-2]